MKRISLFVLLFFFLPLTVLATAPPVRNTVWDLNPSIITSDDVWIDFNVTYEGVFETEVFDRRIGGNVTLDMHLFTVTYLDGHSISFYINPELGDEHAARAEVALRASEVGQQPAFLRTNLDFVVVHKGDTKWAGGGRTVTIHTDWAPLKNAPDFWEEVLMHEACHASLDPFFLGRAAALWQQAQSNDGGCISEFACNNLAREDVAETCVAYIALRGRPGLLSPSLTDALLGAAPSRIALLDEQDLNLEPLVEFIFPINAGLNGAWYEPATSGQGFFLEVLPESKQIFLGWYTYDSERPLPGVTATMGDPGHRWITALGPYEGDTATLTVYQTLGGVFDEETPAPVTDPEGDGTITLKFESCTRGFVNYEITSLGRSGSIPIERIAHDNVELCETLARIFHK